ncbi:hypothetical protein LCGC14_0833390 [marine sediment metagenome]|uniref:Uncharacterized protein n=1 Tax=marine sediment metagenome TaxID=412755 RepID=A0A0F9PJY2_9ZZZZ
MMIVSTYSPADGQTALVVKEEPTNVRGLLFSGERYYRTEVIEVRPEPTYGWEIIVGDGCPARAGWLIE